MVKKLLSLGLNLCSIVDYRFIIRHRDTCTCISVSVHGQVPRTEWVLKWPGQVVIAGCQTFWTAEVSATLQDGHLPDLYKTLLDQVQPQKSTHTNFSIELTGYTCTCTCIYILLTACITLTQNLSGSSIN